MFMNEIIEKDLKNFEITEEIYKMIYENYVEKKLNEGNYN